MQTYTYLVHFQYLGFRYHGWQKQPQVKTIELMIAKTTRYILGPSKFKILGCSRTDAKVSANHSAFELFVHAPQEIHQLETAYNRNLPNDIKVLKIEAVEPSFNILTAGRVKEYAYLFAHGLKCHPFCAPLMSSVLDQLDIELMREGALLFQGRHNFVRYCTQPRPGTQVEREVFLSKIEKNRMISASFFPPESYVYHIHAKGFLRYQVRLIMGQLFSLGRHEIGLKEIEETLQGDVRSPLRHIAPSSGLILNKVRFD